MQCFGCDVVVDGDDLEDIADRFVAHAAEIHDWSYPEEAMRNYARNYAEATERQSDATDRLPEIGEVEVHAVTEDRIDDWLDFFDHRAFAGNPDWAACYCLEIHDPPSEDMPERPWRQNRAAMVERLRTGTTFGYLAYVDGEPAGWVNASPRSETRYRAIDPDGPEPSSVVGVSCFVIAPPYRRHGVATALLDRVVADASGRGAEWVEGYPSNIRDESETEHYRGPRRIFDDQGFATIEVRENDTVVRRRAD
jgi:GNAT superfamily N-acetyltransferase